MLKKLYDKSELWFALTWIIFYIVLASAGDLLSEQVGVEKSITLPILLALCTVLLVFVAKHGLWKQYGLCKAQVSGARMLFYVPLIVLLSANLWYGVALNAPPLDTALYVLSMLCVGFLEEMIFRGFLFCAMAKHNVTAAVIVSSITFGIGHLVNLINGSGAELVPNLLQVVYAMATGFAFVMIYVKSKSLLPCIITHSLFNSLSAFMGTAATAMQAQIVTGVLITLISVGYALYLALAVKQPPQDTTADTTAD